MKYIINGPGWQAALETDDRSSMVVKVEGGTPELARTVGHGYSKVLVVCRRNGWPYPQPQPPESELEIA